MKLNIEALKVALVELGDAARHADARGSVLNAAANIIASVGHGSSEQQALMDAASAVGFTPTYYASSIRVGFDGDAAGDELGGNVRPAAKYPIR